MFSLKLLFREKGNDKIAAREVGAGTLRGEHPLHGNKSESVLPLSVISLKITAADPEQDWGGGAGEGGEDAEGWARSGMDTKPLLRLSSQSLLRVPLLWQLSSRALFV